MIRYVTQRDIKRITEIYNDYIINTTISFEVKPLTEDEMRNRIESVLAHGPFLVWEEDGEIAGYCYAHPWKERAAYHNTLETTVYLAPQYFRRGIGSQLMRELINQCRVNNIKVLIACITANNEASIKMHEALGFKQVSYFSQVGEKFGQWLDVIDMQLTL
ncbi:MAG: N-acetyltransferase [Muribaculaceae bacterium]|nr:N-acetyltransferase [Muribaculaceae bacterium]